VKRARLRFAIQLLGQPQTEFAVLSSARFASEGPATTKASETTATLPDLVAALTATDAKPDLVLKIDIEGHEWEVFADCSDATFSKIAQIVCEFHDLSHLEHPEFRDRAHRALSNLTKHFAPVHVHANNYGRICNVANNPLPDVLEVSFANRNRYSFVETNETYPTPLDAPNCSNVADIRLGTFQF
jgi:hypothetical protein